MRKFRPRRLQSRQTYHTSLKGCSTQARSTRRINICRAVLCFGFLYATQVRFLQSYQRGATHGAANSGRTAMPDDLEAGRGARAGVAGEEQASVFFVLVLSDERGPRFVSSCSC